jgi:hypothetical protein
MHTFSPTPACATEKAATEKGNERIRSILEEAKNALVEEGFSGLSFRTIAKRAGITVGNVTYYFPTKDDLMVDLPDTFLTDGTLDFDATYQGHSLKKWIFSCIQFDI